METIFSMNGRIGRGAYVARLVVILAGTFATSLLAGVALGAIAAGIHRDMQPVAVSLSMLIGVSGSVLWAFQAVKRLHDLGRSGAHYFLLWVPLYNIYLGLELLFRKGAETPNQYGDDPAAVTRLNVSAAA